MDRFEYALLTSSLWLIACGLADGFFQILAGALAGLWMLGLCLIYREERRDRKIASRIETWRR